jgi:hypothetical protein
MDLKIPDPYKNGQLLWPPRQPTIGQQLARAMMENPDAYTDRFVVSKAACGHLHRGAPPPPDQGPSSLPGGRVGSIKPVRRLAFAARVRLAARRAVRWPRYPRSFAHHHFQETSEDGSVGQAKDRQLDPKWQMAELIDQRLMVGMHIEAISKESDPQSPTSDPQQFPNQCGSLH